MSEEYLYRVHEWVKFDYSEINEYVGEGYTDKPLRNDEVVDLLNNLTEENKELKSDRDYWKTLAQSLAKKNGKGDFE